MPLIQDLLIAGSNLPGLIHDGESALIVHTEDLARTAHYYFVVRYSIIPLLLPTGLGFNADCTASNQVRIGNSAVTSIGRYAN